MKVKMTISVRQIQNPGESVKVGVRHWKDPYMPTWIKVLPAWKVQWFIDKQEAQGYKIVSIESAHAIHL